MRNRMLLCALAISAVVSPAFTQSTPVATTAATVIPALVRYARLPDSRRRLGRFIREQQDREGFDVHEQHGGHSSISFDYCIMVRRVGHENDRLADATAHIKKQPNIDKN